MKKISFNSIEIALFHNVKFKFGPQTRLEQHSIRDFSGYKKMLTRREIVKRIEKCFDILEGGQYPSKNTVEEK